MGKRRKTYVSAPEPRSPEGRRRYLVLSKVQAGMLTVSEGARELGMSRVRFQTLLHRALAAMVEALEPKAPGRPAQDPQRKRLAGENERLRKENERCRRRLGEMEQVLELAAEVMTRRIAESRARRGRGEKRGGRGSSAGPRGRGDRSGEEDPERERRWADLEAGEAMRCLGLRPRLTAALLGVSGRTLRRWRRNVSLGMTPWGRRGSRAAGTLGPVTLAAAEGLVRRLRGLVGAAAIRNTIDGISRREAAGVKARVLTAMERERKQASRRVVLTRPGVLRGFDAMYVRTTAGWRFPLVAADGAVPYRTSVMLAAGPNGEEIAASLARDFDAHGAPLVVRLDRASAHQTEIVRDLLEASGVLALHGPGYYARYYGQLERQNREHRAWLDTCGTLAPPALAAECEDMIHFLSAEWRRPTLGWRTAAEVWEARADVDEDRQALREEVNETASHLIEDGVERTLAMRLAIEKALQHRGYLHFERWTDC